MIYKKALAVGILLSALALEAPPVNWAAAGTATVKGYVLDSACAFVKNLKKPISTDCAIACAKAGSPLVILSDGGRLYWPISDAPPAKGQNDRLMEFAGKRVTVTGKVYEKGGSHGLVIEKIEAGGEGK